MRLPFISKEMMAMLNIPTRTIVQFTHDMLFLSAVRLNSGKQVLGLTSRPTDWTISFTAAVNGLPDRLKLVGTTPASNRDIQWVTESDNLIHLVSSANQHTFVINFINGSSSACTLMAGCSPDSFFAISPRDGKFVVHTVNAQRDATRFNILFPSYANQYDHGHPVLHN
jgi:L-2-hydroxyglutarate oxidase LhgO